MSDDAVHAHHYTVRCTWSGSTAGGYERYDRAHEGCAPPATAHLELSADRTFRGDPARLNPEQLVVLAASSCQLLSFLAVAAIARVDVLSYEDDAEGFMPTAHDAVRLTLIILRPTIRVATGADAEQVRHLVEAAHRDCYVANSLNSEIRVEPTVIIGVAP